MPTAAPEIPARNTAMDAYRGFVMLLIATEVLAFPELAKLHPGSGFWGFLGFHWDHVDWAGCSLHDLIQPSFSFLVGVALPYSIAARLGRDGNRARLLGHALWRGFLLVALGVFLRSQQAPCTYFTFEDTLSQIGLGYPFLVLLGLARPRWQWPAFAGILFGYWLAWALYPVPGAGANLQALGVPAGWHHDYTGFMAHWNINTNLGAAFDRWFLNLFHRPAPFLGNNGGYLTLSFIPTLATMILGLVAGRWLRDAAPAVPYRRLAVAALACAASGLLLHAAGICPVVKRIWTPSWTLFSGGLCLALLMAFNWAIQTRGWRAWATPLVVVGMNSIAAYLLIEMCFGYFARALEIHLGWALARLSPTPQYLVFGGLMVALFWLALFWMHRRRLFLRI